MLDDAKFARAVAQAAEECTHPLEEEGGVILHKESDYCFVKINNIHQGTDTAIALYEAEKNELGRCVFDKYKDGWLLFASFHTHPQFAPYPSSIDLGTLFQGFEHNVIYAPLHNTFSYSTWENGTSKIKKLVTKSQLNENQ
jgi:proteasome lid subunit RPN8/RPN11